MNMRQSITDTARYARCIEVSRRVRWTIDDVIRGRDFDYRRKFLPDGLSLVGRLDFLSPPQARLLSQVQGRTYANMFGLVERFIGAKILDVSRDHWLGDQTALEALVRFTDEELKHQELFRRLEAMMAGGMPPGYRFLPDPNGVATLVLGRSTWAVLALTCLIELFTQAHYRSSIEPDPALSELWKDVFLFHWREESQHAILDELEWVREDARLTPAARRQGVDDLIALVAAVDGLLSDQAGADAVYFEVASGVRFGAARRRAIRDTLLSAYRHQYILTGVDNPRFAHLLASLVEPEDGERIAAALAPMRSAGTARADDAVNAGVEGAAGGYASDAAA